jgi:hypothetical protein
VQSKKKKNNGLFDAKFLLVKDVLSNLENSKSGTVCAGGGVEYCAATCEEISRKKTKLFDTLFINDNRTLITQAAIIADHLL